MKHRISSLCAAMCMALVILPAPVRAAGGLTLDELREKFPEGKYWNHEGKPNDPDGWTDSPCTHHDHCDETPYDGTCGCNGFYGIQCYGFANKLTYDVYGTLFTRWDRDQDLSTLKAGDVLRLYGDAHSIFVTRVQGDSVYYADCNWGYTCIIRWDVPTTRAQLQEGIVSSADGVYHASYEAPQSPAATAQPGDADGDGTLTVLDAVMVQKYLVRSGPLTAQQFTVCDMDGDAAVTVVDLTLLKRSLLAL